MVTWVFQISEGLLLDTPYVSSVRRTLEWFSLERIAESKNIGPHSLSS